MLLVKVKFLEEITIMTENTSGSFITFLANSTHIIPYRLARMLQREGYCTFVEKAISYKKEKQSHLAKNLENLFYSG